MKNVTLDKEEVTILQTVVCEAFTVKLRSDGIVHSHTSDEKEFNVESLKKFTIAMGEMTGHKQAPLLLTLDEFAIPPVETRVFWAKKESCPYASAEAYFTTIVGHRIIGNVY